MIYLIILTNSESSVVSAIEKDISGKRPFRRTHNAVAFSVVDCKSRGG